MKNKTSLHIVIKKQWFDQIASGVKTIAYREHKDFWINRLQNPDGSFKQYETIYFQAGYHSNAPYMITEFVKSELHDDFEIHVGKILETGRLNPETPKPVKTKSTQPKTKKSSQLKPNNQSKIFKDPALSQ